jgi:uncharacterized peroxidase-related enzyme
MISGIRSRGIAMRPFIPWVEEHEATGKVAEIYNLWKSENPDRDAVPFVLKCFSLRPDFLESVYNFSYKLQFADGYLTRRQKELIGTYVSSLNNCPYCRGSHAYFLQCQVGAQTANAVVRDDLEAADVSDAERELLRFAGKLTLESHTIRERDIQRLRDSGWSDKQIAEGVYVTAMFALFNRIANAFGLVDPNYAEILKGKDVPDRPAFKE